MMMACCSRGEKSIVVLCPALSCPHCGTFITSAVCFQSPPAYCRHDEPRHGPRRCCLLLLRHRDRSARCARESPFCPASFVSALRPNIDECTCGDAPFARGRRGQSPVRRCAGAGSGRAAANFMVCMDGKAGRHGGARASRYRANVLCANTAIKTQPCTQPPGPGLH